MSANVNDDCLLLLGTVSHTNVRIVLAAGFQFPLHLERVVEQIGMEQGPCIGMFTRTRARARDRLLYQGLPPYNRLSRHCPAGNPQNGPCFYKLQD